jgi:hypothetical protein
MKRSTTTSQGANKKKKVMPTMERDDLNEITTNDIDTSHLNEELQSPSSTVILSTIHSGMEWFNHHVFGHPSNRSSNTIQQEVSRHDINHSPPITTNIESNVIDQDFVKYMIRKRIDPSKFTQLEEDVVAHCNIQERVHQKEFEHCLVHTDIRFAFDASHNVAQNIKNKTRSHITNAFIKYVNYIGEDPRYDFASTKYELRYIEGVFSIDDFRSYLNDYYFVGLQPQATIVFHFHVTTRDMKTRILVRFCKNS